MTGILGPYDELTLATQRVQLDLRKVGATLATQARLERYETPERMLAELTYRLTSYVLSDHIVKDAYTAHAEYETPATWWQAWKQANLDYLLRWFPVRLTQHSVPVEVRFDRYATYPRANIAIPADRLGAPVIFETVQQVR